MDGPIITLEMLNGRDIHVVGNGALGSRIVDNLCCYRVPRIFAHDYDAFEGRNRYNQRMIADDIGRRKPDAMVALAERIDPLGTEITPRYRKVDGRTKLSGFVFLMVHGMENRRQIWEKCIRGNPKISLMVEARMGVYAGKIYGVNPNNRKHIRKWESHWHPDGPDALPGCKAEYPAPSTADIVAGEAMWRFLRWMHKEQGDKSPYYNYIGFTRATFKRIGRKVVDLDEKEIW